MQVPFAQVLGRFTQKKAPGEVATPWGLGIYCIFLPKFMVYLFCGSSRPSYLGREVKPMIHILTILESAVANIISHYICKWLDRLDKDRKPD